MAEVSNAGRETVAVSALSARGFVLRGTLSPGQLIRLAPSARKSNLTKRVIEWVRNSASTELGPLQSSRHLGTPERHLGVIDGEVALDIAGR